MFLGLPDPDPLIRGMDPDPDFLPIPDPGVKRAPDPGSGSATLTKIAGSGSGFTQKCHGSGTLALSLVDCRVHRSAKIIQFLVLFCY
jgi:hypothetical protein